MRIFSLLLTALLLKAFPSYAQRIIETDICIYGGTSAGVIAAYTARKLGHSVILIEPGHRIGGMTTGGLGYTDIGNKYAITGLSRDFYRRVGKHYGKFEQWIFEPKVAEAILQDYLRRGNVNVIYHTRLNSVTKSGSRITEILLEDSERPSSFTNSVVKAKVYMDCTYEGDLMAKAKVSYTVGRESNAAYDETINGVQLMDGHQFPQGIDPYRKKGDPSSGLVWGVEKTTLEPNGTGDKKVQAYNYRICLTNNPKIRIPITRPEGYDSSRYELALRLIEAQPSKRTLNDYFIWSHMPNGKTDINNRGGFSTDMIGMNYDYADGDYETRKRIIRDHELYTKGLLYFFGHDARVPEALRTQMLEWGYPSDEYTESQNWSPQLYIREARRMVGSYVMTQANCEGKEVVTDGVGLAAYTMDSHNCQRIVVDEQVKNEGNVEVGGFGPYPISYRALLPKRNECTNLLVPVCLSATHIAYGSIRMEPVFMVLAQSSAFAANLAIKNNSELHDVDVATLQLRIKDMPLATSQVSDVTVDNDDASSVAIKGNWRKERSGGYGPSYLVHDERKGNASVRFTPVLPEDGPYQIYAYFPKSNQTSSSITLKVFDGKKARTVRVKSEDVTVEGQTSGEWASLGTYSLPKGKKTYVEINGEGADNEVAADAVIWVKP